MEEITMAENKQVVEAVEEEFLFEGGPSMTKVEEWKSQYMDVYTSEIDETIYIWRPINRKEYKELVKNKEADSLYREERLCEKCILWPEDYNFMKMSFDRAGVPSTLAEQIMEKSGFVPTNEVVKL
jgi:hypothetical protein